MILGINYDSFYNDFYTLQFSKTRNLVLNSVKENFTLSGRDVVLEGITIQIEIEVADSIQVFTATNIIGLSDAFVSITSDYKTLQGVPLTRDNAAMCRIELYE